MKIPDPEKLLRLPIAITIVIVFLLLGVSFKIFNAMASIPKNEPALGGPVLLDSHLSNTLSTYSSFADVAQDEGPQLYLRGNSLMAEQSPLNLNSTRNGVIAYKVKKNETLSSIAFKFDLKLKTILWANPDIRPNSLKVGQTITVLPTDGVLHKVISDETLDTIAQLYNVPKNNISKINKNIQLGQLASGIVLVIPDGTPRQPKTTKSELSADYFAPPVAMPPGYISQGLHKTNAIDFATPCGQPVFATADGVVISTKQGWDEGFGNYIEILHEVNGSTVTMRYAHLQTILVHEEDVVNRGDKIGLVGETGLATGCHVHLEVYGMKNPFAN